MADFLFQKMVYRATVYRTGLLLWTSWDIQNQNFIFEPNFGQNSSQTVGLEGQKPAKKSFKYPFSVLDAGFLVRFGKVRQGQA